MFKFSLLALCFLLPGLAVGAVQISEVAWMGTEESVNDEWIELYNDSSSSVSLEGWRLVAADGSPDITLVGDIQGQDFYILERTDDTSLPGITADYIYAGALNNNGETFYLYDKNGTVIDQIINSDGWVAGDSSTKETMQRQGNTWVTAAATPKSILTATIVLHDEGEVDKTKAVENSNITGKQFQDYRRVYEIEFTIDGLQQPKTRLVFKPLVTFGGDQKVVGKVIWNFGDGTGIETDNVHSVVHSYYYPGDYQVSVEYYQHTFSQNPVASIEKNVSIQHIEVIPIVDSAGNIKLSSNVNADISGWTLRAGGVIYSLPKNTKLRPRYPLSLVSENTNFGSDLEKVDLHRQDGIWVSSWERSSEPISSVVNTNKIKKSADVKDEADKIDSFEITLDKNSIGPIDHQLDTLLVAGTAGLKTQHWTLLALIALLIVAVTGVVLLLRNHKNSYTEEASTDEITLIE